MGQGEPENDQARTEQDEPAESFRNLVDYLDRRPELGLGKMLGNVALEPPDPFKRGERRKFKKGFVIAVLFLTAFVAWFAWFNLIR